MAKKKGRPPVQRAEGDGRSTAKLIRFKPARLAHFLAVQARVAERDGFPVSDPDLVWLAICALGEKHGLPAPLMHPEEAEAAAAAAAEAVPPPSPEKPKRKRAAKKAGA
jgi:hypothetical protein